MTKSPGERVELTICIAIDMVNTAAPGVRVRIVDLASNRAGKNPTDVIFAHERLYL